ncbi:glycosyltransferase [uncultured Microbacterium sp.]|uniref:glycosyltransferase n=1 Tax=uncultured Microbacterium sp. TaxID=191216 RepID=UPI0028D07496|nr:glycosyltransferase [uncultured Microbacterium sp.]
MTTLSIVQPYVPTYRLPFFEGLRRELAQDDIELEVVAGQATDAQKLRGDEAHAPWIKTVQTRELSVGGRTLSLTYSRRLWKESDAVIVPHQGTSIDAVSALASADARRVGVWGHIASYTSPLNPVDGAVENWQLRRAGHVFAYVPSGAAYAIDRGIHPDRVTTVMNTIDTTSLDDALNRTTEREVLEFRGEHEIPDGPFLAYIGGLDSSKRVDLLVDALGILHSRRSRVHVVVAGRGEQEDMLAPAIARGQVTHIGYASPAVKAPLLKGAAAIVNPGRVGLIAVDALTSGRRLITTDWPWHAPEIEYLVAGESVILTGSSAEEFAQGLQKESDESSLTEHRPSWPQPPRLHEMIGNYRRGVLTLLSGP